MYLHTRPLRSHASLQPPPPLPTSISHCPTFQDVRAVLPPSARSLYYVDLIGNISSSNTRKTVQAVSEAGGGWEAGSG